MEFIIITISKNFSYKLYPDPPQDTEMLQLSIL